MRIPEIRDAIRAEIAGQMQHVASRLTAGVCADYAEYRQHVGRIAGHKDAMDAVDRVFKKLMDDED